MAESNNTIAQGETWRSFTDFPDYEVSNIGRVRSLKNGGQRILRPHLVRGVLTVNFHDRGRQRTYTIPLLLKRTFPETYLEGEITYKACSKCKQIKSLDDFYIDRRRSTGRHAQCKACTCAHSQKPERRLKELDRYRRRAASEEFRDQRYRKIYGITLEDFNRMVSSQEGKCAICRMPPKGGKHLAVDHCHKTGIVRSLLCCRCNSLVAWFENHPSTFTRLRAYLGYDS